MEVRGPERIPSLGETVRLLATRRLPAYRGLEANKTSSITETVVLIRTPDSPTSAEKTLIISTVCWPQRSNMSSVASRQLTNGRPSTKDGDCSRVRIGVTDGHR